MPEKAWVIYKSVLVIWHINDISFMDSSKPLKLFFLMIFSVVKIIDAFTDIFLFVFHEL